MSVRPKIQQIRALASIGGGVPATPMLIEVNGDLVVWEPSGEVKTLRIKANQSRKAS